MSGFLQLKGNPYVEKKEDEEQISFTHKDKKIPISEVEDTIHQLESSRGENSKPRYEPAYHKKLIKDQKSGKWIPTPAERKYIAEVGNDQALKDFSTSRGEYQMMPDTAYRNSDFVGKPQDLEDKDLSTNLKRQILNKYHRLTGGDLEKTIHKWNNLPHYLPRFKKEMKKKGFDLSLLNPFSVNEASADEVKSLWASLEGNPYTQPEESVAKDPAINTEIPQSNPASVWSSLKGNPNIPDPEETPSKQEEMPAIKTQSGTNMMAVRGSYKRNLKRIDKLFDENKIDENTYAMKRKEFKNIYDSDMSILDKKLNKMIELSSQVPDMEDRITRDIINNVSPQVGAAISSFLEGTKGKVLKLFTGKEYLTKEDKELMAKYPKTSMAGSIAGGVVPYVVAAPLKMGSAALFGSVSGVSELADVVADEDKKDLTLGQKASRVGVATATGAGLGWVFGKVSTFAKPKFMLKPGQSSEPLFNSTISRVAARATAGGVTGTTESLMLNAVSGQEVDVESALKSGALNFGTMFLLGALVEIPNLQKIAISEAKNFVPEKSPLKDKMTFDQAKKILSSNKISVEKLSPEWQSGNSEVQLKASLAELKTKFGVQGKDARAILVGRNINQRGQILDSYAGKFIEQSKAVSNPALKQRLLDKAASLQKYRKMIIEDGIDPRLIFIAEDLSRKVKTTTQVESASEKIVSPKETRENIEYKTLDGRKYQRVKGDMAWKPVSEKVETGKATPKKSAQKVKMQSPRAFKVGQVVENVNQESEDFGKKFEVVSPETEGKVVFKDIETGEEFGLHSYGNVDFVESDEVPNPESQSVESVNEFNAAANKLRKEGKPASDADVAKEVARARGDSSYASKEQVRNNIETNAKQLGISVEEYLKQYPTEEAPEPEVPKELPIKELEDVDKEEMSKEPSYTVTTADIIPTRQGVQTVVTDKKSYDSEGKEIPTINMWGTEKFGTDIPKRKAMAEEIWESLKTIDGTAKAYEKYIGGKDVMWGSRKSKLQALVLNIQNANSDLMQVDVDKPSEKAGRLKPYQMTQRDFQEQRAIEQTGSSRVLNARDREIHRNNVKLAILEGKEVPDYVLKDYPGLMDEIKAEGREGQLQKPIDDLTKEDISKDEVRSKLTGEQMADVGMRIGNKAIDEDGPNAFGDTRPKMRKGDKDWTKIKEEHEKEFPQKTSTEGLSPDLSYKAKYQDYLRTGGEEPSIPASLAESKTALKNIRESAITELYNDEIRTAVKEGRLGISYLSKIKAQKEPKNDILKSDKQGDKDGSEQESDVGRGQGNASAGDVTRNAGDTLESVDQPSGSIKQTPSTREKASGENYRITDADSFALRKSGQKQRYQSNITAVKLLKKLESEDRKATTEEQSILIQYVGWGGLSQAFDENNTSWTKEYSELKSLLTKEEYDAARASTINAHYTSFDVVKSMWGALKHLGFTTGKVLEPSAGTGHFIGLAPHDKNISFTGVELDSITGRIAKQLYQKADIQVKGFQDAKIPMNYYDVAISNVPFSDYKPYDSNAKKLGIPSGLVLHDYFFAKSLEAVKPGGIVAFITSKGTMDKVNSSFREYMSEKARFLGAMRLPNTAFKENASTEVVTDIIFLQKYREGEKHEEDLTWTKTEAFQWNNKEVAVNSYFMKNKLAILGSLDIGSGLYSDSELIVTPTLQAKYTVSNVDKEYEPTNIAEDIDRAVSKFLPKDIIKNLNEEGHDRSEVEPIADSGELKEGAFTHKDGKIYQKVEESLVEQDLSKEDVARMSAIIRLRDSVRNLLANQVKDISDNAIKKDQQVLNTIYTNFKKKYGYVNDKKNSDLFWDDPDSPLLASIEKPLRKVGRNQDYEKGDIFTERVVRPHKRPSKAGSPKDAIYISLGEYGKLDFEYMSQLTNSTVEKVQLELSAQGYIFKDPTTDEYVSKDEYLSGDVKKKLREAKKAGFQNNVDALTPIIPKDLGFDEIDVNIGMPWIEESTYEEFLADILSTRKGNLLVVHSKVDGRWKVEQKGYFNKWSDANTSEYGTTNLSAVKIFEYVANSKPIKLYKKAYDAEGEERKEYDEESSAIAQDKATVMKNKFKEWFWDNKERREKYLKNYNDNFNTTVKRIYDGQDIVVFPSMNPNAFPKGFRSTQKNAIWRGIQSQRMMLAHEVGAGKTAVMIATAMESKRLGLINKSMVVVPRNTLPGWKTQINQLYPTAKVLIADEKNFVKDKRLKFLGKIATGNWDIIVIPESSFLKVPVSKQTKVDYIEEELDLLRSAKEDMRAAGARISVKNIEKAILAKQEKLKETIEKVDRDDVVTFEELGVDALFVDEADKFKNLAYTSQKSAKGMGTQTGADKTADMMMKTRIIRGKNGKLVFATGTPISNSMVEAHAMMRYLQPELLEERGLSSFDDWSNAYGEVTSSLEVDVTGGQYKVVDRFSNFVNVPELMSMLDEVWDIQTSKMLEDAGVLVKGKNLPFIKGGRQTPVVLDSYPELDNYTAMLIARSEEIKNRKGPPQKGDDIMLTVLHDGLMAAIDMRLIDPMSPANPNSKVEYTIKGVVERWRAGKKDKTTQIIFLDKVRPDKSKDFNPHYYMRKKMVAAGIPDKEIAFIHDYGTREKQEQLFADVNEGKVRIIFGSTEKLGAGTNIQERLATLWHMDQPFRPRDITQREGRIIRPGNTNKEVEIMRLSTKGTLDTFMWQMLEAKAKSIEQLMSGQARGRTYEETEINEYEALKALTSGNPLLLEKAELDKDIRVLKALSTAAQKNKFKAEATISGASKKISDYNKQIEEAKSFISNRPEKPTKETFSITLDGKSYTDKKDAHGLITAELQTIRPEDYGKEKVVGEYLGSKLYVKKVHSIAQDRILNIIGVDGYDGTVSADPIGTFVSLDKAIYNNPEVMIKQLDTLIDNVNSDVKSAESTLSKGFDKGKELEEKQVRLKQVERELQGEKVEENEGGLGEKGEWKVPIPDFSIKEYKPTELEAAFETQKDIWFGNKDWRILQAGVEKKKLQRDLRIALNEDSYNDRVKLYDKAIHMHIDLKRNPGDLQEYYDLLSPEQKKIVDVSQDLPEDVQIIADQIEQSYKNIGLEALDADVIHNVLDNYVGRVWDLENKSGTQQHRKFGTTTRHAKSRKLETILEGWGKGYALKVEGATNNLELLKKEIVKTIEDKAFLKALKSIKDIDGNKLISTQHLPGYTRIEHRNFKTWKWSGKADPTKIYGTNTFQDDEGNIYERVELYAPDKQANNLNDVLGVSALKGTPAIDFITKYNAVYKSWILQSNLFHHLAFIRSYYLGTNGKKWKDMSIRQAYREGLKAIEEMHPVIELMVRNGLTLGIMQDWEEDLIREKSELGKKLDKWNVSRVVKDKILDLRQRHTDFLFGSFGAGLKAKAAMLEYVTKKKEHPEMSDDQIAKEVATLLNDDFGGLHLGRLGRNPTSQHIMRIFLLASDWTESNVRTMVKAFGLGMGGGTGAGGKMTPSERKYYQRFWAGVAWKALFFNLLTNLIMASLDEDDARARGIIQRFIRNYRDAWMNGEWHITDTDITPIYRFFGGKDERRRYWSILGHFKDPIKWVFKNNAEGSYAFKKYGRFEFGFHPLLTAAKHKSSVLMGIFSEAMSGTDWKGERFTTFSELVGRDYEKGLYERKSKKKDGTTHYAGDPKYGQSKGKTVVRDYGPQGVIHTSQVPSFLISQAIGVLPAQLQNLVAWMEGEMDGFSGITKSGGLRTSIGYGRPESKTSPKVSTADLQKRLKEYKAKKKQ